MIKTENLTINGEAFIRTYSDSGHYVVRNGVEYSEAIDPVEFGRQYTEGNQMEVNEANWTEVDDSDVPASDEITDTEALEILLGGGV